MMKYSEIILFCYLLIGHLMTYSRVHISSDTALLKILKNPSIAQE